VADLDELLRGVIAGERGPLARLLTAIESDAPGVREQLPGVFRAGRGAHLVGITGPPGSGKSTLVNALTAEWRRRGKRVGILAVDPSSPYTGGAIMGDRIRMMDHAGDPDVFVRSMASRGELGGLAATTWIAAAALDAAGFDPVLVETVGAGQSEVEVARLAETTVVVEVPEMGDEVQAIKAGLLEVADVLVVNKGDRPGADRAARQLRAMLSTAGGRVGRKPPPILLTTATTSAGVPELADAIDAHRSVAREPEQAKDRARNQIRRALADVALRKAREMGPFWESALDAVASRTADPLSTAETLLHDAYWMEVETKTATEAARLEQAIHGGLAVEVFPLVAEMIERKVGASEWYTRTRLMEELIRSNQLGELLSLIEARARESAVFRHELVVTMNGFEGNGGTAVDRLHELAAEFKPQWTAEFEEPESSKEPG
jgi:LAO/AO transport system kinase